MKSRVCVNMIVKDEAAIIEECCKSLAILVDAYVICDTGSSDDTVARIRHVFESAGIPGEIHHTTFVNFEQARNEALVAARNAPLLFDYILLCDADMELVQLDPAWRRALGGRAYSIIQRDVSGGLEYSNLRLVRRDVAARYVGVTHEYLDVGEIECPIVEGLVYLDHAAGSSRSHKFERDVRLLSEALDIDPDNSRYAFYLANSYFDLEDYDSAIDWYQRRLEMEGYFEETFVAKYRIGLCHLSLGDEARFFHQLLLTFDEHPERAEPLHSLALYAQQQGRHRLAHNLALMGVDIPKPVSALFIEPEVYEWRLADIVAVSLYWMGQYDAALTINRQLLSIVPESERVRIAQNVEWCERAG